MWGAGALILLVMLLVGGLCLYLPWESGRWELLPSMLTSIWHNGWSGRLQPVTELPPPSVPALDVELVPGVHLSAPAGALDKPRDFRATPFGPEELGEYFQPGPEGAILPLAGFDIDGGMTETDLFNGPAELDFDLKRLNLPPELWDSVTIARVAPDGTIQRMITSREGNSAKCQIRHNNPYLLVLILGLKVLYLTDQVIKGNPLFHDYMGCDVGPYFHFAWPRSIPLRNSPERRELDARFEQAWARYRPPDTQKDNRQAVEQAFRRYMADPQVQGLYKTFNDVEWKKRHYFPAQVTQVVDAFEKAASYLFENRGFRRGGNRVEVYCVTPWKGNPETYGYQKDGHFTYPYIHINLDKVPSSDNPAGNDATALDNLRVTAVHELFHVSQKEYYNWTKYLNPGQVWGGGVNHWFMEATALVLEEEARAYYLVKGWNKTFPLTADNLYSGQNAQPGASRKRLHAYFKVPMDSGGTETESAHRGYAASQFLLALRARYYSANLDAFLPAVLGAFGTFRRGPVDALVKATSGSDKVFGADYLLFCAEKAKEIFDETPPATLDESLNPAEPVIRWSLTGPVSSPCLTARIRGLGGTDLQQSKVLVRTNNINEVGHLRRLEPSGDFRTITGSTLLLTRADMAPQVSQAGVSLQRVESYTSPPYSADVFETEILLLAPPRDMPKVQFDNERQVVRVEIPPSVLRRRGQVKEYQVTLYRLGNGRPLKFTTEGKSNVEIAWRQIADVEPPSFRFLPIAVADFTPQEILDMMEVTQYIKSRAGERPKLQLTYHEVVAAQNPVLARAAGRDLSAVIDGPESRIFEVPVEGFQLPGARYDISGSWNGQVWIARIPLTADLNQSGDKLTGTCSWGTDSYRVDGTWNSKEDAWEITLWVKEGGRETPALMTLYLRALPGEKLWLGAPPCVLRRPAKAEEEGGWFSWFKW